jgi:dTDP-4-amino-4,6-dideoxygalactose transaminase
LRQTAAADDDRRVGARSTPLPFALPDVTQAEIDAVVEVLQSGWLTTGPRVRQFEAAFADYLGVRHAVALNSGTAALHLALEAIGLRPGDEVIVPTYTFAASADAARYVGGRPVLVDVEPDTLTLDPSAVGTAITPRTRAIIGVDLAGQPCDWHLLRPLAERHGLLLVDDAAHALPSHLNGRPIGRWADLTAFSFYATKPLATGEGGMLVTDTAAWAARARLLALHGISTDAWNRSTDDASVAAAHPSPDSWRYEIIAAGFKYNMSDITAALGLVQLQRLDEMYGRRAAIAAAYTAAFADLPEVAVPSVRPDRTTSWHLYILRLHLDRLSCDRAEFIRALDARRVKASVHFIPLHLHAYYRDAYGCKPGDFPVAYGEYQRAVSLPIYSRMSEQDVADVIEAVKYVVESYRC